MDSSFHEEFEGKVSFLFGCLFFLIILFFSFFFDFFVFGWLIVSGLLSIGAFDGFCSGIGPFRYSAKVSPSF
jgi:hypothetical protein